jgi:chemotaxis protein CheD
MNAPSPISGRYGAEQRLHIVQGEYHVTDEPNVMLTTLLGSCVSACMRDPINGIGGMNHFLLPGAQDSEGELLRYGVHAMELLVNGILSRGGRRERLTVQLFGGARMTERLSDVGSSNADFAEDFVRREGINHIGGSLRGDRARRIQLWPSTGRVRQLLLERGAQVAETVERPAAVVDSGKLELF